MRTTVDIPDALYKALKVKAAQEGVSIKHLVLRGTHAVLKEAEQKPAPRLKEPLIKGEPGTLYLTNEMIDDLLNAS